MNRSANMWMLGPPGGRAFPTLFAILLFVSVAVGWGGAPRGHAQQPPLAGPSAEEDAQLDALAAQDEPEPSEANTMPSGIDLITLIGRGGKFMWPIGFMSLLVVTLAVERIVSFRRGRMIPRPLVQRLQDLIRDGDGRMDVEGALEACRRSPSPTANVVSSMLMRAGRPLSEVEQAATETAQREADDHAGPIRWLNLAAAATPLMGLLGTVWGMIVAFHNSATVTAGISRSEQLSEGIYTALVTTLAGLAVAIPAAILAQYLENRLTKIFHRIEKLALSVAPTLQHHVGKIRVDIEQRVQVATSDPSAIPEPPPVVPMRPDSRNRNSGDSSVGPR